MVVHQMPRWNPKGGDKIEILQTGEKRVSEMVGWVREIYDFDVADARIFRLDLTADVLNVPVDWFRRHVRVALKQLHRTYLTVGLEISKRQAETVVAGKRPKQHKVYNKTLQREQELLPAHNRKRKAQGLPPETFLEVFGYDPSIRVSRVERQMGEREPATVFGIDYFGDIQRTVNINPFEKMIFPAVAAPDLGMLGGEDLMAVLYLRQFMDDINDGLQNARNQMQRCFGLDVLRDKEREAARRRFYRKWKLYEEFLHHSDAADLITPEKLLNEYKATTMVQLAA